MITDSLNQVQDAVATQVQTVATEVESVVAEVPQVAETAWGWSDMLLMALFGFLMVFAVLVLLIIVMGAMGKIFTYKRKVEKVAEKGPAAADEHEAMSDQEVAAAIITALKLYKSNLHDRESEMLTINRITRAYSPWSSKIHGLTQLPERK